MFLQHRLSRFWFQPFFYESMLEVEAVVSCAFPGLRVLMPELVLSSADKNSIDGHLMYANVGLHRLPLVAVA